MASTIIEGYQVFKSKLTSDTDILYQDVLQAFPQLSSLGINALSSSKVLWNLPNPHHSILSEHVSQTPQAGPLRKAPKVMLSSISFPFYHFILDFFK